MFLFLSLLLSLATSATYNFGNFIINITSISTGDINASIGADRCRKLIARNSYVYHLSTEGVYQSWQKGSFGTAT